MLKRPLLFIYRRHLQHLCLLLFHGPWLGVHWPSAGRVLALISLGLFAVSLPRYWTESQEVSPSR